MKRFAKLALACLSALAIGSTPLFGKDLGWADLKVATSVSSPLNGLSAAQKRDFLLIESVERRLYQGGESVTDKEIAKAYRLAVKLQRYRVSLRTLLPRYWARAEATARAANQLLEAHGTVEFRVPGYALPLAPGGGEVREFLLVPYVGACIHVPAPPIDQIIRVKVDGGFKPEGRYQQVWVTGKLKVLPGSSTLHLVDGSTQIQSLYEITASAILPGKVPGLQEPPPQRHPFLGVSAVR